MAILQFNTRSDKTVVKYEYAYVSPLDHLLTIMTHPKDRCGAHKIQQFLNLLKLLIHETFIDAEKRNSTSHWYQTFQVMNNIMEIMMSFEFWIFRDIRGESRDRGQGFYALDTLSHKREGGVNCGEGYFQGCR